MNQAWLITKIHNENHKVVDTFIALLNADIPSETIRQITEEFYYEFIGSSTNSLSHTSNKAQYRILPDGSPHTEEIICGHNPGIYARHAYNVNFITDINESHLMNWREAHMFMQDDTLQVEYWEDFSMTISSTRLNNNK